MVNRRVNIDFGAKLDLLNVRPVFAEPGQTWYDRKTGKRWVYAALDVMVLDEIVAAVDDVELKRYDWIEEKAPLGANIYGAILDEVNFMRDVR